MLLLFQSKAFPLCSQAALLGRAPTSAALSRWTMSGGRMRSRTSAAAACRTPTPPASTASPAAASGCSATWPPASPTWASAAKVGWQRDRRSRRTAAQHHDRQGRTDFAVRAIMLPVPLSAQYGVPSLCHCHRVVSSSSRVWLHLQRRCTLWLKRLPTSSRSLACSMRCAHISAPHTIKTSPCLLLASAGL